MNQAYGVITAKIRCVPSGSFTADSVGVSQSTVRRDIQFTSLSEVWVVKVLRFIILTASELAVCSRGFAE